MDYKDTLFLPTTNFPMRGNLPQNEPIRYTKWQDEKIYEKMKKNRASRELFTFHDGPPYANGHIHIGHALNKILKDIIVKQHYFRGHDVRFTPGWDCHGLPIEQQVEKELADKKETATKAETRKLCRDHASKYVEIQKEGFKSLGVIADWDNPYITMDYKFEAEIYRELCRVAKAGLLVERKKPVFWSWAAKSALAEAEVEYQDKESDSIFVAFTLDQEACEKLGVDEAKPVIWTTTPWTLPANVAIALSPDQEYVLTTDSFLVAKELYGKLLENGVISGEIAKTIDASMLEGLKAANPLNGRESVLILGDHVSMEDGTGLVHTAPGHGEDDYKMALKYSLDVVMPVDEGGLYDYTLIREKLLPEEFVGMHIFKANEKILEMLASNLLKHTKIKHSYPYCWRTHKPVIFRATKQWFIAMDEKHNDGKSLRESAMASLEGVSFYPPSGKNRLSKMVETRPDWCISRQRVWGVPIAFLRDKKSGEVLLDDQVLAKIAGIFEKESCDSWVVRDVADFLPDGYDAANYEKVEDILDVWFDSGSTQSAVLRSGNYDAGKAPADLYLEGSDQHRGWFQSSLLTSMAAHKEAPFCAVLTHGFTVDENGNKMSKSKGNVVAPDDVAKKMGSEILRLWVAMSDYKAEVKISQNILKQVGEQYRKLRNTFRFMLANISDLESPLATDQLAVVDKWIVSTAKKVFDEADEAFREYEFSKALYNINGFVVNEFSGIYLDMIKDRIYCDAVDSHRRRSAQSAIYYIASELLGLIAPVLTYTADEIIEHAPKVIRGEMNDLFDYEYRKIPDISSSLDGDRLTQFREAFFEVVDQLKKDQTVKNTLELEVVCEEDFGLDSSDLADFLTISKVTKNSDAEKISSFSFENKTFAILRSADHKCPRCWKFVSLETDQPCNRCKEALDAVVK